MHLVREAGSLAKSGYVVVVFRMMAQGDDGGTLNTTEKEALLEARKTG